MSENKTNESVKITTTKGRVLTYRNLKPSEVLRLVVAAGEAAERSALFLRLAQPWCSVREIDGVPVPFPGKVQAIEALSDDLGPDGVAAVDRYWSTGKTVPPAPDETEDELADKETTHQATLKN